MNLQEELENQGLQNKSGIIDSEPKVNSISTSSLLNNNLFKDIIQRHTSNGKFNLATSMLEIEQRLLGLEEAMSFFSNWYNKTQRTEILIPSHLKDNG